MIPCAFHIFLNVPVAADGKIRVDPPRSKAHDYIRLRAQMNLVIGLTACSAYASNGGRFKPIGYASTTVEWLVESEPASGNKTRQKGRSLAIQSLSNYGHIVIYCLFFLMTTRQFRSSGWRSWGWALGLTTAMGIAVEITEGLSGHHHCKAIDLIPNFIGTLLGLTVVVVASATLGRRSGSNGLSE
jgi:VanZ family protein